MILEIDAGNTFLKWRMLDENEIIRAGKIPTADIGNSVPDCWDSDVNEAKIASVAGVEINTLLTQIIQSRCFCEPRFAKTVEECAGVSNSYQDPSRMGVDRWLVMLAAYSYAQNACCVIDCGSAITVDFLNADGLHLGGYIMPGLRLMNRSLLADTAEIVVDQDIEHFDVTPGTHTSAAVSHGVNFVFKALQEKVVRDIRLQNANMSLFVTGGDGLLFHELCSQGEYIADLVMDGLRLSEWQ